MVRAVRTAPDAVRLASRSAAVIGSKSALWLMSSTTPGPMQRSSGIRSMVAAGLPADVAP